MMAGGSFEGSAGGLLRGPPCHPYAVPDSAFVLAARGLRRLHVRDEGFLGYTAGEMFWQDVLELVHEDDLPRVGAMISEVVESPGASLAAGLRLRDASGHWKPVEVDVRNVLEAPGDAGLVVADFRAARAPGGNGRSPDGQR